MKSTKVSLMKRGYVKALHYDSYINLSKKQILCMIHNDTAVIRSIGVLLLSKMYTVSKKEINQLVQQLSIERALYTKIYICELLTSLDIEAMMVMLPYLGKIGNNQYKQIPDKVSSKKSYPLARDIVARTIANMSLQCFPKLLDQLSKGDEVQVSEILDVIGYMLFYHPQLIHSEVLQTLYQTYVRYQDHLLIVWKLVTCLSGFTKEQGDVLLNIIDREHKHPTILAEIERTRRLRPKIAYNI